jgi:hypothetical protein
MEKLMVFQILVSLVCYRGCHPDLCVKITRGKASREHGTSQFELNKNARPLRTDEETKGVAKCRLIRPFG